MSSNTLEAAALLCLMAAPAGAQVIGTLPFPAFCDGPGCVARGSEVTANFNAVKSAVNAYDATIKAYADASSAAAAAALVPAGAVLAFNLGACPAGWHELDGTGGYVDARGYFVRGLNTTGAGLDPGRTLASTQTDDIEAHTHSYTGSPQTATTGGGLAPLVGSATLTSGSTGGTETRPHNIAFRLCQKT